MGFGREGEGPPIEMSTDKPAAENLAAGVVMAILFVVEHFKGKHRKEAQKAIERAAELAKELERMKATQAIAATASEVSSKAMLPAAVGVGVAVCGVAGVFMSLRKRAQVARDSYEKGIPPGPVLTEEAIKAARRNVDGKTHVAVVGHSGVGKSTLVNRLRGLKTDRDDGAAVVSENEGTTEVTGYESNMHPGLVWYDVPGAGTQTTRDWQYFLDQKLYEFDALVVLFADRILEMDLMVLRNARALPVETPTFFVRAKSDRIIRDIKESEDIDEETARERYVESTKESVRRELAVSGLDESTKVYMVSRDGMRAAVHQEDTGTLLDEKQLIDDLLTMVSKV